MYIYIYVLMLDADHEGAVIIVVAQVTHQTETWIRTTRHSNIGLQSHWNQPGHCNYIY